MNTPAVQAHNVQAPYVCPDCKHPLMRWRCAACGHQFSCSDGVPRLVSRDPRFERAASIGAAYDAIYTERTQVWENQGRTPEFIAWFGKLLDRFAAARMLEIGCGEGFVLATRRDGERFATDLSVEAIRRARRRADAQFSLALAERLPFAGDSFDLVASVGVMEHFLDIGEALAEIRRVLVPAGRFVGLTHVDLTLPERLGWIATQFVVPRLRPVALARWVAPRLRSRLPWRRGDVPQQPIQNRYTTTGVQAWLARAGFTVEEVMHTRTDGSLPLIGPSVVVFVARN